jgi:hypothetical protein
MSVRGCMDGRMSIDQQTWLNSCMKTNAHRPICLVSFDEALGAPSGPGIGICRTPRGDSDSGHVKKGVS